MLANWFGLVVAVGTLLQYLYTGKCRTGQNALLGICWIVQEADIAIQIGTVRMAETLNVALERHGIAQVVVLRRTREGLHLAEDGVVNDDSMNVGVVVGGG